MSGEADRTSPRPPRAILETCVYAEDLDAAERFYGDLLGLERIASVPGRHLFFRCGDGVFLVFNPLRTRESQGDGANQAPRHGADGAGHVAFATADEELAAWRSRFQAAGIAVEAELEWPRGGRSLYVRDPAGNSVELASPRIWGLPEGPGTSDYRC